MSYETQAVLTLEQYHRDSTRSKSELWDTSCTNPRTTSPGLNRWPRWDRQWIWWSAIPISVSFTSHTSAGACCNTSHHTQREILKLPQNRETNPRILYFSKPPMEYYNPRKSGVSNFRNVWDILQNIFTSMASFTLKKLTCLVVLDTPSQHLSLDSTHVSTTVHLKLSQICTPQWINVTVGSCIYFLMYDQVHQFFETQQLVKLHLLLE